MTTPLEFGDPPILGPFQLSGRLSIGSAGIVYLGGDQEGRQVSVALLNRGAASDAAARDRFRAAITGGHGVDRAGAPVVAADPDAAAPWVATAYDPQRGGAERFLEPVAMTDAASGAMAGEGRGPDFQPHWAGAAEPAVPAPPVPVMPASGGGSGPKVLILGVVAGILVLVLGVSGTLLLVSARAPATSPSPSPSPLANSSAPTSAAPSPAPTGGAGPTAAPLRTSGPKVVGATWGPGDDTYTMEGLKGLGFSFRVPGDWGCMRSDKADPPTYRWVCIDEAASFAGKEDVAGFVVLVTPCDAPCDAAQRTDMRKRFKVDGKWREADDTTAYAEWTDTDKGTEFYHLAMSHFWHKGGSTKLNSQVFVLGEAPAKDKAELQKTVNDIRANTP